MKQSFEPILAGWAVHEFFVLFIAILSKGTLSYRLCFEYFSQLSIDSEMYT